jgi:hypothetical protein
MKKYIGIAIVASVFVIGFTLYRLMSAEGEGRIVVSNDLNVVKSAVVDLKTYDSEYFSVAVPSNLKLKTSNINTTESILAQYAFWSQDSEDTRQIAITVGRYKGASVQDIPFIKQRMSDAQYETQPKESNAPLEIKRTDGTEVALFSTQDDRYVAIVASGQGVTGDDLRTLVDQVWGSYTWK